MPIKPYAQHDHAVFTLTTEAIPDDEITSKSTNLLSLLQDLYDTHFQNKEKIGVGLHAKQIGVNKNVFLTVISPSRAERETCEELPLSFWVVKKLESVTNDSDEIDSVKGLEGCFSVAGCCALDVPRAKQIKISGWQIVPIISDDVISDIKVIEVSERIFSDFPARLLQHEYDHGLNKFYFHYIKGGLASTVPMVGPNDPRTNEAKNIAFRTR